MDEPSTSSPPIAELESVRVRMDRNAHGHILQALELQWLNDVATFITTIGGVIAMALSAAFLGDAISMKGAAVSLAAVSGTITLVGVLQAVWRPGVRAQRHKDWSGKYASLENDCRLALCGSTSKSLKQILVEAALVSEQADLVPERLWNRARLNRAKMSKFAS